jgi:tetratricopeptide (TPR) repeat protein
MSYSMKLQAVPGFTPPLAPRAMGHHPALDESTRQLEAPRSIEDDAGDSLYLREHLEIDEVPAGTRIGRYSVLSRLGEGGMGTVYKAWDAKLGRLVALKVLRTAPSYTRGTPPDLGLIGEAQTLARIDHPNIVTVYDAGVANGRVFIAIELCRGQNLRQWLAQGGHSVQAILRVFTEAGRGLAAAHLAGVVHRDFKPANVLIDEDGSVQVADFSMARMVALSVDGESESSTLASDPDRSVSTIMGTPAYMAPEQLLGRVGDHRMDQFSFCLCLYWALVGHPPFGGRTFQERRRTVPAGLDTLARERLSRARRVPVRVRRALLRGLCVDPNERFASMDALLAQLAGRRSRRWALSAWALTLGSGLGAVVTQGMRADPCDSADAALSDTWNVEQRRALADAFERARHPHASEQAERIVGAFDQYAHEWADAHSESCKATYVTHVQSEAMFDQRMRCLERRRVQLELAVETLSGASDAYEIDARMSLPFMLPAISECSDVDALEAMVTLPPDEGTRARIDELVRRVDLANTLRYTDALKEGLAIAREAVAEAREVGHLPALALALECLGRLQADGESPRTAELTLREAIEVGTLAHDERLVARAWPSLVFTLVMQGKLGEAESLGFAAGLTVERVGDELARGWLFNALGTLYSERGSHEQAHRYLQLALDAKTELRGAQHYDVAITWSNMGSVLANAGRWSEAADAFDRAQAIFADTVGPDHQLSGVARTGVCRVAVKREEYEHALALCTEILHGLETTSTSPTVMSRAQVLAAKALRGLGRAEEALQMMSEARTHVEGLAPHEVADIDEWIADVRREQAASDAKGSPGRRPRR